MGKFLIKLAIGAAVSLGLYYVECKMIDGVLNKNVGKPDDSKNVMHGNAVVMDESNYEVK